MSSADERMRVEYPVIGRANKVRPASSSRQVTYCASRTGSSCPSGRRLARALEAYDERPLFFIDIDPRKIGRTARGVG